MIDKSRSPRRSLDRVNQPVVLTDLDDTLFQTRHKIAETETDLQLAATSTNGCHSYMTPTQASMVEWLIGSTRLIPVTARSTRALARCQIPFTDWMIASNGAVILDPAHRPDEHWQSHIKGVASRYREQLQSCDAVTSGLNMQGAFRHWLVEEFNQPVYFCAKSNGDPTWLDQLTDHLAPIINAGLSIHRNGSTLSITPPGISKAAAVEYLLGQDTDLNAGPVFAMGDGLTDLPFMGLADMMMTPPGSQIDRSITRKSA